MTDNEDLRAMRKSSLIVVLTLGGAVLFMKDIRPLWMTNIFEGTSFMKYEGIGFVLKALSFVTLGLITAAVAFIIHFFKLIYYSIEISRQS